MGGGWIFFSGMWLEQDPRGWVRGVAGGLVKPAAGRGAGVGCTGGLETSFQACGRGSLSPGCGCRGGWRTCREWCR